MEILQLILLFILALSVSTLIKQKTIKWIIAAVFSFFFTLQLTAVYLTGSIADYKFYEHLRWDVISNIYEEFLFEGILLVAVFFIVVTLLIFLSNKLKNMSKLILVPVLLVTLPILSLNGNIFNSLYKSYSLRNADSMSLENAIDNLQIKNAEQLLNNEINAKPGKNIIFLSLESYERGFIKERPDLTPHLNAIAKDYFYYDMQPSQGGDWTSASAFMALTGMPAFFGEEGNDIFQGSKDYKLNTLGDVYKSAGYKMSYLLANKEFSGVNDMLQTIGFEVKSEEDFETKYERIPWGLHDKDLFDELKKEILSKKEMNKPFAIYVNTISTHFPDGLYDKRMEGIISPQDSDLEFMVAAVDYFVGQLYAMLKKENLLETTTLVIVPDHKFMSQHDLVNDLNERGLFLLSTDKLNNPASKELFQFSIPSMIIDVLGIETNAVFLSDLVKEKGNEFINANRTVLRDINVAALNTVKFDQGFEIRKEEQEVTIFNSDFDFSIASFNLLNTTKVFQFELDKKYRIIKSQDLPHSEIKIAVQKPLSITIDATENEHIKVFYTDEDGIVCFKQDTKYLRYEAYEMISKFNTNSKVTKTESQPNQAMTLLNLRSASFNSKSPSHVKLSDEEIILNRGLNTATVDQQGNLIIKNFDTYLHPESIEELIRHIQQSLKQKATIALIAHDTAGEHFSKHQTALNGLGLKKLIELKNRQAYIAILEEGKMQEVVDDLIIETSLNVPKKNIDIEKNSEVDIVNYNKDVDRFIAHAAGKIDDKVYTNSLEALNHNYDKGFRWFELDIIKTSDNHFVSTHDWDTWKKQTGYEGATPVTLEVFNSFKLFDSYTAMDMAAINKWFKDHEDAVLVTDKTREIEQFGKQFVDKNRLIMEVFQTKDAEKAKELGIEPMLSENIISGLDSNLINFMKKHDMKYLAFSRNSISKFKDVLQEAKNLGYKSYVYHVNFQAGKDEKYVVEHELGQVYGMYADKWDFNTKKK